jgi:hypothetical protein
VVLTRVEFRGQSGAIYSFVRLEGDQDLRAVGVTYVVAEPGVDDWRLLGVGHTNNLAEKSWDGLLAKVRDAHPGAQLLFRLNVSRSIREAETDDLKPVLN